MYIVLAVVSAVVVALIVRRRRASGDPGAQHGWMSERWVAEHRASHKTDS